MPALLPCTAASRAAVYRRRAPEHTLLYELVAAESRAVRRAAAEKSPYGHGLPRHVDKELDAFLDCGILARGFARIVCRNCRKEHLLSFSCKNRGICPSCTARRMCDSAAHLVDRVLPWSDDRQWVVTFSRRVRDHLAADPALASLALQQVLRTIFCWQRARARLLGARPPRARSNAAVTFVQRFNSALELSLHFHILIPDGLFLPDDKHPDTRPRLLPIDPPTNDDVAALLDEIITRVTALLKKHGRLDDALDDEPDPQILLALRPTRAPSVPTQDEPLPRLCARKDGDCLHAGRGDSPRRSIQGGLPSIKTTAKASSASAAMASALRFPRAASRAPTTASSSTK